jgi:hypothetical protein
VVYFIDPSQIQSFDANMSSTVPLYAEISKLVRTRLRAQDRDVYDALVDLDRMSSVPDLPDVDADVVKNAWDKVEAEKVARLTTAAMQATAMATIAAQTAREVATAATGPQTQEDSLTAVESAKKEAHAHADSIHDESSPVEVQAATWKARAAARRAMRAAATMALESRPDEPEGGCGGGGGDDSDDDSDDDSGCDCDCNDSDGDGDGNCDCNCNRRRRRGGDGVAWPLMLGGVVGGVVVAVALAWRGGWTSRSTSTGPSS